MNDAIVVALTTAIAAYVFGPLVWRVVRPSLKALARHWGDDE